MDETSSAVEVTPHDEDVQKEKEEICAEELNPRLASRWSSP